jgi:hypothetical protein
MTGLGTPGLLGNTPVAVLSRGSVVPEAGMYSAVTRVPGDES